MIFLDDSRGVWLTATSRQELIDVLFEHLDPDPELWQIQMIAAACLGHHEPLSVSVIEE